MRDVLTTMPRAPYERGMATPKSPQVLTFCLLVDIPSSACCQRHQSENWVGGWRGKNVKREEDDEMKENNIQHAFAHIDKHDINFKKFSYI